MRNAKYIVYDDGLSYCMVVFSNHIQHSVMAAALTRKDNLISAGFVSSSGQCYGESVSLGIKSRSDDDVLLRKLFDVND